MIQGCVAHVVLAPVCVPRRNRLSVHRTPRHIYAQVIAPEGDKVLGQRFYPGHGPAQGATGNIDAAALLASWLLSAPRQRVSRRSLSTAVVTSTTDALRLWPTPPVKVDWNSKGSRYGF